MNALMLTEPGKFEIRETADPKPGPFEVLYRIRAVAICGSDPEIIRGGSGRHLAAAIAIHCRS